MKMENFERCSIPKNFDIDVFDNSLKIIENGLSKYKSFSIGVEINGGYCPLPEKFIAVGLFTCSNEDCLGVCIFLWGDIGLRIYVER